LIILHKIHSFLDLFVPFESGEIVASACFSFQGVSQSLAQVGQLQLICMCSASSVMLFGLGYFSDCFSSWKQTFTRFESREIDNVVD
jgi:hypothetical protein